MNRILFFFGMSMAIVYVLTGILLIFFGERLFSIPAWVRISFGCLLIIYGVFRFKRYKNITSQEG